MCSKKMVDQTTTRRLHDNLIFDEILMRLPPAAVARCRAVCRAWHTALTSDDFLRAYGAALQPELLFFATADASTSSTLYTCALRNNGEAPSAARELLTLGNLSAAHAVVSPRPCHGLTLVSDGPAAQHYVCNLSTGEHVALPPCERAAAVEFPVPMRIGVAGRCHRSPPWVPFEIASTGLGFDPATGEHKVVRLFKKRIGETGCEVCTPAMAMAGDGWRPCAGRVPPPSASFIAGLPPVYLRGSLYFLLELNSFTGTDQPVMSFSVGAERFGWVHMPPFLAQRVGTLTELDGALCAVVDLRYDHERYLLYTWGGGGDGDGDSWSKRYLIDLQSLPPAISDEFVEEDDVIPLCSCRTGGSDDKLLLATGFHKVFAYDPKRVAMERVLCMQEFVDVPAGRREARFLLQFGLYQDSIASAVHHSDSGDSSRLQVKRGTNTVCRRQVRHVYRNVGSRRMRDLFKHFLKETAGRINKFHNARGT
ncbi:hypothetical protein BDA96_05G032800 [Sorghum bicolor]|uniref:F-box domain-containing protein n=1 Tax=Sorghum bicolor TaxID=4558 RepID=A0A921QXV9_SORBI|nr:hypothetical protein BDA96_05G032800 [Sorghum bicolor]